MTLLAVPFGVTTAGEETSTASPGDRHRPVSYWFVMSVFIANRQDRLAPPISRLDAKIIVSACALYLVLTTKT